MQPRAKERPAVRGGYLCERLRLCLSIRSTTEKKMTPATHKECAPLCARLADLKKERSAIEARRAAKERLGVNSPADDAIDTVQLRGLAAELVPLQQLIKAWGCDCDCDCDADDGGASPGPSPSL